jgi:hypothetical protein
MKASRRQSCAKIYLSFAQLSSKDERRLDELAVKGGKHPCGIFFPKRCHRFQDEVLYWHTIRIEPHLFAS